jgi:signal peptidase I
LKNRSEELKAIIYTGPSMNPTLQNLDRLLYDSSKNSKVKRGDIVVFFDQEKRVKVIHRVKQADNRGIVTMGDNNSIADASILHPNQIIGRVIYGERKNRKMKIYNGFSGTIQVHYVRWIRDAKKAMYTILKPPYYLSSGKFKLPIKKRILTFEHPNGKEIQIALGKIVVARQLPGEGWRIRPPFRLFLDEKSLSEDAEMPIDQ